MNVREKDVEVVKCSLFIRHQLRWDANLVAWSGNEWRQRALVLVFVWELELVLSLSLDSQFLAQIWGCTTVKNLGIFSRFTMLRELTSAGIIEFEGTEQL